MIERNEVLKAYQAEMSKRWEKGYLNLDDVHALKIFCQINQISNQEHGGVVEQVGLDSRQLMDEENRAMDDWLAEQNASLPTSNGGLAFAPPDRRVWKKPISAPPLPWQNLAAIGAAAILLVAVIIIVVNLL